MIDRTSPAAPSPFRPASTRPSAVARRLHRAADRVARVDALLAVFPACARVLGRAGLRRLLGRFVRAHPCGGSSLFEHARQFPGYLLLGGLRAHPALLPDLARLEIQVLRAQQASPAPVAAAAAFAARLADPAGLPDLRFELQPAAALLESDYPIASTWLERSSGRPPGEGEQGPGEAALVTAGAEGVRVVRLDGPAALLVAGLLCQSTLGEALDMLGAAHPDTDPGDVLAAVIATGVISALRG